MKQELFALLERINVVCRDDGERFVKCDRIDRIDRELSGCGWSRIGQGELFYLYGKRPLPELPERPVVISTHIDCVWEITRFFTRREPGGLIRGTFDNALTNMAAVAAMVADALPEHTLVAFTGNEEDDALGASELTAFLRNAGKDFFPVVLDVTDMGYEEGCLFTIENDFSIPGAVAKAVVDAAEGTGARWGFVASDPGRIPRLIPKERIIRDGRGVPCEAECDESWEYDERNVPCFSLCIPVRGDMHGNGGVAVREDAPEAYIRALGALTKALAECFS